MLIVFFGPTGAGKSTIIKALADAKRLEAIEVITTRHLRSHDPGRHSVSDDEYAALELAGAFKWTNTVYGSRYGTPRQPVDAAVRIFAPSHSLDFSIENMAKIESLEGYRAGMLLLPPWGVLRARLIAEGREDRLHDARWQYRLCEDHADGSDKVIENRVLRNDDFDQTYKSVNAILDQFANRLLRI